MFMVRLIGIVFLLSACGLKYAPQITPVERQLQRQEAVERSIREVFKQQKTNYVSIAFGETVTIKPPSFQVLDSLFEVKYRNEQAGRTDLAIDEAIQRQRLICQNDTNPIIYREEHIFALEDGNTARAYVGLFDMDKQQKVLDVEFVERLDFPARYLMFYKAMVLRESFMYPGYAAEEDDLKFFAAYIPRLQAFQGSEKNTFLIHMLRIMEIASIRKHMDTQKLLMEITRDHVHKGSKDYRDELFSEFEALRDDKKEIAGYRLVYAFTRLQLDGALQPERLELYFDKWLQPL
jgi:hypothetical protein